MVAANDVEQDISLRQREPYPQFASLAGTWFGSATAYPFLFGEFISWGTPELSPKVLQEFEKMYSAFGYNIHSVVFIGVNEQGERVFPILKFAEAWTRVVVLPNELGYQVIVFTRAENKDDKNLITHELSHPIADGVTDFIDITWGRVLAERGKELNPNVYRGIEIPLWHNVFREGLTILLEPTDTIELSRVGILSIVKEKGYKDVTIFEFLTKLRSRDKRNAFYSEYVLMEKLINACITAEHLMRFVNFREKSNGVRIPFFWEIPYALRENIEGQIAFYKGIMNMTVTEFLQEYYRNYQARREVVLNPLLSNIDILGKEY